MSDQYHQLTDFQDLAGLHGYWNARREGRAIPPWRRFDPVEMRPWLGRLNLVEVEHGPEGPQFTYRVFATELARVIGRELTGRRLGDGDDKARELLLEGYLAVVRTKAPILRRHETGHGRRLPRHVRLMLPIGDDDATVTRVLVGIHPLWQRRRPPAPVTDFSYPRADAVFGAARMRAAI